MTGIWKALSSQLRPGKGYKALNNIEEKDPWTHFTDRAECQKEGMPNSYNDTFIISTVQHFCFGLDNLRKYFIITWGL